MDPVTLLAGLVGGAAAVAGLLLTLLNIREKLWPKLPKPHPLAAPLADIAQAIRELRTTGGG